MSQTALLEELKKIRQLLEPLPAPPPPTGLMDEFKEFLSQYKVMGLAIAFILGLYLGALVNALVDDLIMPLFELVVPGVDWEFITIGPFRIGHFAGTLLTFLIVELVIFILFKLSKKMKWA
jgi:large conductance mechanosensitive channel